MARHRLTSVSDDYGSDIYKQGEELLRVQPSIQNSFVISHLNHKSSVLCPKNRSITEQYLALEQLDAHHKMIANAKGHVDTSAPKSLQSYLSSIENARRNNKKPNLCGTRTSSLSGSELKTGMLSPPAEHEENKSVDQVNTTSSSAGEVLDKGIQTSTVLSTVNSKVADKITWYLEAVSKGEFIAQPAITSSFHKVHRNPSSSHGSISSGLAQQRVVKGDVMDWHHDKFKQSKRPFSPRILMNNNAKSKVHDMRCYNSPSKKISRASSGRKQMSQKFENSNDVGVSVDNASYNDWITDQAWRVQIRQKLKSKLSKSSSVHVAGQESFPEPGSSKHSGGKSSLEVLSQDEESKYLKYLSEVTEDILRSGVYTDRAIKRAFDFHLQFHDKEADRDKLIQLLEQVLEDLSVDDSEDPLKRSSVSKSLNTVCSSPPEKETLDQCDREQIKPGNSFNTKINVADLTAEQNILENTEASDIYSSENCISHDVGCIDSNEVERHRFSVTQIYQNNIKQYAIS